MKKICLLLLIVIASAAKQSAGQLTVLHTFSSIPDGQNPEGSLITDGTYLYGTTYYGGTNNVGTIFKIKSDGSNYVKLFDFTDTSSGAYPLRSLISDGTFLYGMTVAGGANTHGTIFKIKYDGSGFAKLLDFLNTTTGRAPNGSFVYDGTYLYGVTSGGGSHLLGNIFKIKTDGTGFVNLYDFTGDSMGYYAHCSFILIGDTLYGLSRAGGTYDFGYIFKIGTDGSGLLRLRDFQTGTDGAVPEGSLIYDGTFLYGMAKYGGVNGHGTIFKIKQDGSSYSTLFDFGGVATGSAPYGSLVYDGSFMYGMTSVGGTSDSGVIFKIKPDGSGYQKLYDFTGAPNGSTPYGSLTISNNFLYGTTYLGGINRKGVIFKYDLAIGINELSLSTSPFTISPNPFTTELTIKSTAAQSTTLEVSLYDVTGKALLHQKSTAPETKLNTEGIAAGLYFLRVEDGNGVGNYKVVKGN